MFVSYSDKGGATYARLVTSRRVDGRVVKETSNLGRVVDRERHVFRSRERGTFTFDPETGEYGPAPAGDWPAPAERLVLDFGDAWALDWLARSEGLWGALDAASPGDSAELRCLCLHYALAPSQPNCLAQGWWEGSWARVAYPGARLASQRVSERLRRVGGEAAQRRFFDAYLAWVAGMADGSARVAVDSTGLPNSSRMPLTAVSNHNGEVSEECRLTCVLEQSTGLPVYLRVAAGNVVDVTTLERTFAELEAAGLPASWAVLDAGYWSAANVRAMQAAGIRFLTRLKPGVAPYKRAVAERLPGARKAGNLVEHGGRYVYVDRAEAELADGVRGWTYLCVDMQTRGQEQHKLFGRAGRRGLTPEQVHERMETMGVFVLASTADIPAAEVLDAYYARQRIEQVFDVGKNYASLLPVRVHSEEALRGHLLLTFCATALLCRLQSRMPAKASPMPQALAAARNQKCKVYDTKVLTCEPTSAANELYRAIGATCPVEIPLACGKK